MSLTSIALGDITGISKRTKACFRRAQLFSAHEVLLTPPHELAQLLRMSRADVEVILRQVAKAAAPPIHSTLDILRGDVCASGSPAMGVEESGSSSESDDSASFVPPTQGYEGNFPGLHHQIVHEERSDSNDEATSADNGSASPNDGFQASPMLPEDGQPMMVARDPLTNGREGHICTSGSFELDRLLNGGFRTAALSEVVGESASGKTQLAIQVCVYAAIGLVPLPKGTAFTPTDDELPTTQKDTVFGILGGMGMTKSQGATCYFTSGGERSAHALTRRAVQLAQSAVQTRFHLRYAAQLSDSDTHDELDALEQTVVQMAERQLLDNLHVACVADVEALQHALHYSLPGLMTRLRATPTRLQIGVIVVDSLPTLFQQEPATSDLDSLFQRSQALIEIADALKRVSLPLSLRPRTTSLQDQHKQGDVQGRAVLVLNHVSDAFGADKDLARQFVFDTASTMPRSRSMPDYPASMGYTAQSAFCSGLLASVPPTLAETLAATMGDTPHSSTDNPLYVLAPKSAQMGFTWSNNVNLRLFLAQTRGRVFSPDDHGDTGENIVLNSRRMTVRRAAVVFSAFGPSMLDPVLSHDTPARKWRKEDRQLRFIITRHQAVHALAAYTIRTTAQHSEPLGEASAHTDPDQEYFTHLDDRDLLSVDLDIITDI